MYRLAESRTFRLFLTVDELGINKPLSAGKFGLNMDKVDKTWAWL